MRRKYKLVDYGQKLTSRLLVYLTPAEWQWVEEQAQGQEISNSAYLRSLLNDKMRKAKAQEKRAQLKKDWGQA